MRNRLVFFFLTLVLTAFARASGNQDFEPSLVDINPAQKEKSESKPSVETESFSPTDAGLPDQRSRHELAMQARQTWTQATNLVVGGTTGVFDKNDKEFQYSYTLGVQRTLYSDHDTANEFGIQFSRLGLLGVDWGYKWLMNSADSDEPFYKLGVAAYYDPADHLANFVDYQRYLIRGSIGFENLFRSFRRLKAEAGAGLGPVGVTVFANVIYAFPD
jgi:hypothetical protein